MAALRPIIYAFYERADRRPDKVREVKSEL